MARRSRQEDSLSREPWTDESSASGKEERGSAAPSRNQGSEVALAFPFSILPGFDPSENRKGAEATPCQQGDNNQDGLDPESACRGFRAFTWLADRGALGLSRFVRYRGGDKLVHLELGFAGFAPMVFDHVRGDSGCLVAPAVSNIGEDSCDLFVGLLELRHHPGGIDVYAENILAAVYGDVIPQAPQLNANEVFGGADYPLGRCKRRASCTAWDTLPAISMASDAGIVCFFPELHLVWVEDGFRSRVGDCGVLLSGRRLLSG